MKKILNMNHLLHTITVCAVLLLISCEHKDLCNDLSHTAKIQVVFDWKNALDATPETMRLYLFPVRGGNPQHTSLPIAGEVTSACLPVVTGLCVNSDTESVLYRDIDSFETFGAYAPDGS